MAYMCIKGGWECTGCMECQPERFEDDEHCPECGAELDEDGFCLECGWSEEDE